MGGKDKKNMIKEVIKKLHDGADPQEMKEQYGGVLKEMTPSEISTIEEELIEEGMEPEEIRRLCDVHLAMFKESLEKEEALAPEGHPIHILMEEHKLILEHAHTLRDTAQQLTDTEEAIEELTHLAEHLEESEDHYLREENVLFPYLEKHGVTQPPAIMWTEHDKLRNIKKGVRNLVDRYGEMDFQTFSQRLEELALSLADALSDHIYKENNILYPTALDVIGDDEWKEIRKDFDEIGYCCYTPAPVETEKKETVTVSEKGISFETGSLSKRELEAMLNSLPVDITFVGNEDTVRYFNDTEDRIFVRTKAVIGRKVQQCHPQRSVHKVNEILEDFRKGTRDEASFWITMNERLVYIRYFAVRDRNGTYLGTLEVTQDITEIQKLEGEKRLLD